MVITLDACKMQPLVVEGNKEQSTVYESVPDQVVQTSRARNLVEETWERTKEKNQSAESQARRHE